MDASFALLRGAFPRKAEYQGTHFHYATKNNGVLIERKRSLHLTDASCPCCNQPTGPKETRFFYWLLVEGSFQLVNSTRESKLSPMRTITDSFRPIP